MVTIPGWHLAIWHMILSQYFKLNWQHLQCWSMVMIPGQQYCNMAYMMLSQYVKWNLQYLQNKISADLTRMASGSRRLVGSCQPQGLPENLSARKVWEISFFCLQILFRNTFYIRWLMSAARVARKPFSKKRLRNQFFCSKISFHLHELPPGLPESLSRRNIWEISLFCFQIFSHLREWNLDLNLRIIIPVKYVDRGKRTDSVGIWKYMLKYFLATFLDDNVWKNMLKYFFGHF